MSETKRETAAKLADRAEGCLNSRNSAYPSDVLRECIAFLRGLPSCTGAAERGKRWYVGAQNDGLFIVNAEPRPSNDDQWHDNPNGPTVALNVTELTLAKAQKIVDVMNGVAAPPVKGDWEAIEKIAERIVDTCRECRLGKLQADTDYNLDNSRAQCIKFVTDAILSLPVQPGAGERE